VTLQRPVSTPGNAAAADPRRWSVGNGVPTLERGNESNENTRGRGNESKRIPSRERGSEKYQIYPNPCKYPRNSAAALSRSCSISSSVTLYLSHQFSTAPMISCRWRVM